MDPSPERLTEAARTALRLADEEALVRNHDYTGQEHLLLGLVAVEEGAAIAILRALGVRPEEVRTELDLTIGRRAIPAMRRPRTPRLERALELAADEADGFQHPRVGSDHLLLGMLREGQGLGADLLKSRGVTLNAARDLALQRHAAGHEEA
jgi:ATP-dependent Clp protease ATP-binding subunit ClpC